MPLLTEIKQDKPTASAANKAKKIRQDAKCFMKLK